MASTLFQPDLSRGYFVRKVTVPIGEAKGIDDGFFRFACIHFEPFAYQNRSDDLATIAGPMIIILEAIMSFLHLGNATVVSPRLEAFGSDMGNGTYSGIMGRLQSGEAYIFLNTAISTEDRFKFIEPTNMLIEGFQLLAFKPRKVVHPFNFARAFEPDVWYVLLASVNLAAICIFIIDRCLVRGRFGTPPASLGSYVWNFWKRFFPQEPMHRQENWLQMALLFFLFAIPMQLMVVFSGELTSSMAVRDEEDHIRTLQDVLRFKKVRIYGESRSILSFMFTHAKSNLFRQLNRQHIPITGSFAVPPSFYPVLEEVEQKQRVIFGSDLMFMNMIEKLQHHRRGGCPLLRTTKDRFGTLVSNIFTSRTLPDKTRRLITRGVRASMESYLMEQSLYWVLRKANNCLRQEEETTSNLSLSDLLGSFTLWAIGLACAIVALLGELTNFNLLIAANRRRGEKQPSK